MVKINSEFFRSIIRKMSKFVHSNLYLVKQNLKLLYNILIVRFFFLNENENIRSTSFKKITNLQRKAKII